MTRLVLHAGTPETAAEVVQAQLQELREPLERSGVRMLPQDDEEAWDRAALRIVSGGQAKAVTKLVGGDKQQPDTILLSSQAVDRPLRKPTNVENLRTFAQANDLTCRVVVVVREQLDLFNALYCDRVLAMETFVDFDSFVTRLIHSTHYRYAEELRALLDAADVEVAVVPYSRLAENGESDAILLAAGLEAQRVSQLPATGQADLSQALRWLPGPILVAATRLLHKRLAHHDVQRKGRLFKAAEQLEERAIQQGWDDTEFWGWSAEQAAAAAASYAPGNRQLAERAWGAAWPELPPARPARKLDLAAQSPALVSDVMTAIHALVEKFG